MAVKLPPNDTCHFTSQYKHSTHEFQPYSQLKYCISQIETMTFSLLLAVERSYAQAYLGRQA